MILWYRLPGFLQLLLPFAWLLALLLVLGRLHAEHEFEVLRWGGVGPYGVLRWLTPSALLLSAIVGYFSLQLAPENDRRLTEFMRAQQANAEFKVVSPGVFRSYQGGRRTTYADSTSPDGEALLDVFMAELRSGEDTVTLRAARGGQRSDPETGARFLVLENGHRYQGLPGQPDYQIVSFGKLTQRLEDGPGVKRVGIEAESTASLRQRSDPEALAELHFRLALPLVVLIGTVLGIGIARTRPRDGRWNSVSGWCTEYFSWAASSCSGYRLCRPEPEGARATPQNGLLHRQIRAGGDICRSARLSGSDDALRRARGTAGRRCGIYDRRDRHLRRAHHAASAL
jgi:lipopolysaccharide export system permease protein